MTLNIQTDRPLRSPAQLLVLVQAVETAASGDEKHWLEWKRGPQLTTREGQAIAARFILAAANRPDRVAASIVGGCAYLVLGIEPGGAPVETPPATQLTWTLGLRRFLGTNATVRGGDSS